MEPTFADGDLVLIEPVGVRRFAPVVPGDVVIARHPFKNLDVIKHVHDIDATRADAGLHLLTLRSPSGDDSRQFGRVARSTVRGRVRANLTQRQVVANLTRQSLTGRRKMPERTFGTK